LLGTKQNMSAVFDSSGKVSPVTVIKALPMRITQQKTKERDGYEALQLGFDSEKERRISKPQRKLGNFVGLREVRGSGELESFAEGDVIQVSGITKGKGFQGVVKRHDFAGGSRTHGQ